MSSSAVHAASPPAARPERPRTSKSLMPGELALHGVGAARREQAGDGALLVLADHRGDGGGEQAPARARMSSPSLGRLVEAGAGAGIGQVAPDAEALQPVEDLLGLRVRQQHRAVVAHVHQIVRRERIAGLDARLAALALGAQAEDDARRDLGLGRGRDGEGAERQRLQHARMRLEVLRPGRCGSR